MSYTIRDADMNDVPQISELMTDLSYPATEEEVRTRLTNIAKVPDHRTIVIAEGERLIGMAGVAKNVWYEKNGTYVRILVFVVRRDQRNKGIGGILIKAVEDWAVEIGANAVVLSSGNRDDRVAAHKFYDNMGYQIKSSGFIKQL